MTRIIIKTSDNSDTIFDQNLNEIFHSQKGALTESKHVFLDKGFNYVSESLNNFSIFEVGFGTGLNAVLTLIEADNKNIKIKYHSIESEKIDSDIWNNLNYKDFLSNEYYNQFKELHNLSWDIENMVSENFSLKKINDQLENYIFTDKYNLIYFDAFAPDKQPILWTYEIFSKIYDALENNGVLVTYSAKGEVKRNLKKVGFKLEKLDGPSGKREMIRAIKNN